MLTIIQRTLLNCINFIDRHIFSKATLNQDLYWLTIKSRNMLGNDGLRPIERAIKKHNIRAMKALINNSSTDTNDSFNSNRTLYLAIDEQFDHGLELILSNILNSRLPRVQKNARLEYVLSKLIERKDDYWLNRILNHDMAKDYKPCYLIIDKCIKLQFIKGIKPLIEKSMPMSFTRLIFTKENYRVLRPELKTMNTETRSKLFDEIDLLARNDSDSSIKKVMTEYAESFFHTDIEEALAKATGLTKEDFINLCDVEVYPYLNDSDCICPICITGTIQKPVKLNAMITENLKSIDEKHFYDYDSIVKLQRNISPITKRTIKKVIHAEQDYSEKVILCFLKYAIDYDKQAMIEHIKNQKTIQLPDTQKKEMKKLIDDYINSRPDLENKDREESAPHSHYSRDEIVVSNMLA